MKSQKFDMTLILYTELGANDFDDDGNFKAQRGSRYYHDKLRQCHYGFHEVKMSFLNTNVCLNILKTYGSFEAFLREFENKLITISEYCLEREPTQQELQTFNRFKSLIQSDRAIKEIFAHWGYAYVTGIYFFNVSKVNTSGINALNVESARALDTSKISTRNKYIATELNLTAKKK